MKKPLGFALACVMILTSVLPAVAAGTNQTRQPDDNLPLYTQGRSHSYDEGIVDGGVYRIRDMFCGGYSYFSQINSVRYNFEMMQDYIWLVEGIVRDKNQ